VITNITLGPVNFCLFHIHLTLSSLSPMSTPTPTPRAIGPADVAPLLALNNKFAEELSWKEPEQFNDLLEGAWYTRTMGDASADALLVAFDDTAAYDNPNFRWLKVRFNQFVYVDRIVAAVSGRGHAGALYRDLFAHARTAGHKRVVCEINVDPPNPGSIAFHQKLGFREVGRQTLENGKTVAYFECRLD
jgi:predicted GNAT superfamily acetyltransferase